MNKHTSILLKTNNNPLQDTPPLSHRDEAEVRLSKNMEKKEPLTEVEMHAIDHEVNLVPYKKAAVIEALKIVQKYRRWISDESVEAIAEYLEMSAAEVDSVATFYNLIYRKPVGKHVILLCDSISCYMMGYDRIYKTLQSQLNIQFGQTTKDNLFTLLPNVCLGCCDHAPVMMIDEDLYEDIKEEELVKILKTYE